MPISPSVLFAVKTSYQAMIRELAGEKFVDDSIHWPKGFPHSL